LLRTDDDGNQLHWDKQAGGWRPWITDPNPESDGGGPDRHAVSTQWEFPSKKQKTYEFTCGYCETKLRMHFDTPRSQIIVKTACAECSRELCITIPGYAK
jgi:hypothetical protein